VVNSGIKKESALLSIDYKSHSETAHIGILTFVGDLEDESIKQIGHSFHSLMNERFFIIGDMTQVNAISSAALGELIGGRTRMVERGGDFVLAGLTLPMREKLTLMEANKIFRFYKDVRSATNAYCWEYQDRKEEMNVVFPNLLKFVPSVRQLVSRIARQKGFTNRDAFRIETIVDEICNNAIEHGIQSAKEEVTLRILIDRQKVELEVINAADPEKIDILREISKSLTAPNHNTHEKRGRGLTLVKMLSNDFFIDCSKEGTSVRVTKMREVK